MSVRLTVVVLLAAIAAGAVLVRSDGRSSGPVEHRAAGARAAVAAPPPPPRYATRLSPVRVSARFKRPPRSGLLFDVRSGRVLWQRRPARRQPVASLAKMMTAIVVADRTRPSDLVPITRRAVSAPGSGVGLLPVGHRVRVEILLYGLLLPSGNDAAVALAQYVGHGSVARFVADMNAEARRQGLRCTHYSSPNGYEDRGNTSCTTDLALLAREVLSRPRLARIVRTTQASFPFLLPRAAKKGRRRVKVLRPGRLYLATHNPLLLDDFPGTIGVKTGYTPAAGACLVAAVRRRGVTLGAVLLDSPDPGGQAERLLDRGFAALRRAHRTRA